MPVIEEEFRFTSFRGRHRRFRDGEGPFRIDAAHHLELRCTEFVPSGRSRIRTCCALDDDGGLDERPLRRLERLIPHDVTLDDALQAPGGVPQDDETEVVVPSRMTNPPSQGHDHPILRAVEHRTDPGGLHRACLTPRPLQDAHRCHLLRRRVETPTVSKESHGLDAPHRRLRTRWECAVIASGS